MSFTSNSRVIPSIKDSLPDHNTHHGNSSKDVETLTQNRNVDGEYLESATQRSSTSDEDATSDQPTSANTSPTIAPSRASIASNSGRSQCPSRPSSVSVSNKSYIFQLLRAYKLQALARNLSTSQDGVEKSSAEPKKTVFSRSRRTALVRGAVHIFPATVSLIICSLNLMGHWHGRELGPDHLRTVTILSVLQVVAKILELLINASLAVIIYSWIRYQLVFGGGVPFGALFAGLKFKDVDFLWSNEFLGTLSAPHFNIWKRWITFVFIATGSLLATTAGPAMAIALQPRLDSWPAGGTEAWLNVTHDALYPSFLSDEHIASPSCMTTDHIACPSGDWQSLTQLFRYFAAGEAALQKPGLSAGYPDRIYVAGRNALRALYSNTRIGIYPSNYTSFSTTQSAIGDAIANLGLMYGVAAGVTGRWLHFADVTSSIEALQPTVHVTCLPELVVVSANHTGLQTFPSFIDATTPIQDLEGSDLGALYGVYADMDGTALDFINLPDAFGVTSLGVTVLLPLSNDSTRGIIQCTVRANWELNQAFELMSVSSISGSEKSKHGKFGYNLRGVNPFFYPLDGFIDISPSWAKFVNPRLESLNNATVFDYFFDVSGVLSEFSAPGDNHGFAINVTEAIISAALTNGIARTGFYANIAGTMKDPRIAYPAFVSLNPHTAVFDLSPAERAASTRFRFEIQVTGYAWNMRGVTMKLAIAALLLYTALTVAHVCYLGGWGMSSVAWDSAAGITTLAMESQPCGELIGCGVGIERRASFTLQAKVVEIQGDRVELVVGKSGGEGARVRAGVKYG